MIEQVVSDKIGYFFMDLQNRLLRLEYQVLRNESSTGESSSSSIHPIMPNQDTAQMLTSAFQVRLSPVVNGSNHWTCFFLPPDWTQTFDFSVGAM